MTAPTGTRLSQRCPVHGRRLFNVAGSTACPSCLGDLSRDQRARYDALGSRLEDHKRTRLLLTSGIPHRYIDAEFKAFDVLVGQDPGTSPYAKAGRVAQALRAYVDRFDEQRRARPGFVFIGNPGTGKTFLACAMARRLIATGSDARYASLPALTLTIRKGYRDGHATEDVIRPLISADFLVLDEIDLHGNSEADYQVLYDILNARYEAGARPTLAISNRPLAELKVDLDERLVSRILGSSSAIKFEWPSLRDRKTKPDNQ
jgi:DNA replication protein DnaC